MIFLNLCTKDKIKICLKTYNTANVLVNYMSIIFTHAKVGLLDAAVLRVKDTM